jgi:uncharacterized FlaG/YvyC family protein
MWRAGCHPAARIGAFFVCHSGSDRFKKMQMTTLKPKSKAKDSEKNVKQATIKWLQATKDKHQARLEMLDQLIKSCRAGAGIGDSMNGRW